MFKTANPMSKIPVYLQNGTKENIVWQLKLTGVLLAGICVYEIVQEKRQQKRLNKTV